MKIALSLSIPAIASFGGGGDTAFYVDSVAGDDGNDGSLAAPFQTLSALTITNGMTIRLKRGSVFRERIDSNGATRVTVEDYGTGQLPVLDCADIVVGTWTQPDAGGNPNVWAITVSHTSDIQANFASMWEDSVRLLFQPTRSEVNSTPGSFCITGSAVGNYGVTSTTFEIHASDSGNPNSNGAVYEYAARPDGIGTGTNWTIRNLRAKRPGHNNGAIALSAGSKAYGCIAEDGVKHNWYSGRGTELYDCIVYNCDYPHPDRDGWTGFVTHEIDGSGSYGYYERCKVVLPKAVYDWRIANSGQGLTAFYAHTDGAVGHNWGGLTYADCVAQYCETAFSTSDSDFTTIVRPRVEGCNIGISASNVNINDAWIYEFDGIVPQRAVTAGGAVQIDGLRYWASVGENTAVIYHGSTGESILNVTRSVMTRTSPGVTGYHQFIRHNGSGLSLTGSVLHGQNTGFGEGGIQSDIADLVEADFNAYGSGTLDFAINGNSYDTVTDYFTAVQPTYEANSVQFSAANMPVTDPANGDFTLTVASGLDPDVFGCARFPTYETIPSEATIAAM